jgi:Cu/Ag efflux protein CusF
MKTHTRFLLLLAFVIALMPHAAHARRSMGTTMTGMVQKVDHASRQIVFVQDGGPVRSFVYTTWAKFWHEAPDASLSALKPGMKVRVNLHQPLIGPYFVTQITLVPNPQP